jgi:arsenite-transporting ATPase
VGGIFKDLTQSIPGIDEAMGFAEIMKQVQTMNFSAIVFDTAPTGECVFTEKCRVAWGHYES